MAIRLWPQDYERKEHITKAERALLKNAGRNLSNGHMVVGIDPLGMSTSAVRMGMYISPREGLITFSLYQGQLCKDNIEMYRSYIQFVEDGIYSRLLDANSRKKRT